MARIFAYCDHPHAGTGFGRSALHILTALHEAGHEIVQLAINARPGIETPPWELHAPADSTYGLPDLIPLLRDRGPFDMLWSTFDPGCPWAYQMPEQPKGVSVLDVFHTLRATNPGFRLLGWFPVDGGPLSDFELTVLGGDKFDVAATMSPHVHDIIDWTISLRGQAANRDEITARVPVVPHGVDMSRYRIASEEERRAAKARLGFPEDCFLAVQVERNQRRKAPWLGLAFLEEMRKRKGGENVYLYQHMCHDEETQGAKFGYRLDELSWRYGLRAERDVKWQRRRFSDEEMVDTVYAAADVVLSTSTGEGFQYPLWEALACGRRVVAPRDSARKAWLSNTPGAHLYKTDERGLCMGGGGYNRRMGFPDIRDACRIVSKMADGRPKFAETPEASRGWVERTAPVERIQDWWVRQVEAQMASLREERAANRVTVSDRSDVVIGARANPGYGDVVLMAPAVQALREHENAKGRRVCWALPSPKYLPLATWLDVADVVQVDRRVPLEKLGRVLHDVSLMWSPEHRGGWSEPTRHRTERVAGWLGVADRPLLPLRRSAPAELAGVVRSQFVQRYGVHPGSCVAIAPTSGVQSRTLPAGHLRDVIEGVIARDLVPVIVGDKPSGVQRVGALDLGGTTDHLELIALLSMCQAAVCVDSYPMHLAGVLETDLVAVLPLFPYETRLTSYAGNIEALHPESSELAGETWPPGRKGSAEWIASIGAGRILDALDRLLGLDAPAGLREVTS